MQDPPASAPAVPPGAALCRACHMCCNGILFGTGSAEADEVEAMRAAGVEVELTGEKPRFRQPCPHSRETGCAIYAERYQVCRKFRCALLRKVEAGTVAETEAARLIAEARRLAARDPALAPSEARHQRRLAGPPSPQADIAAAQAWLHAAAFDRFLDRHFRHKPSLQWSEGATMSADDPDPDAP